FPLSVVTTSTLDELGQREPESHFDARRFRMNVVVETPASGFVENDWVGHALGMGEEVRVGVALPDPRCVMPSLAQEELPNDPRILKGLVRPDRRDVGGKLYPCVGVYAVAETTGTIRRNDSVRVL